MPKEKNSKRRTQACSADERKLSQRGVKGSITRYKLVRRKRLTTQKKKTSSQKREKVGEKGKKRAHKPTKKRERLRFFKEKSAWK